jgi:hypothetical protein
MAIKDKLRESQVVRPVVAYHKSSSGAVGNSTTYVGECDRPEID